MSHSQLQAWADEKEWRWPAIGTLGFILLIGCYLVAGSMDSIEQMQAMEDEREEALRYEQVLIDQAQYRQKQCGGPEATVVEQESGGFYCLDKKGRKTNQRSKT